LWAFRSTEGSNPSPSASEPKSLLSVAFMLILAFRPVRSASSANGRKRLPRRPFVPPPFPPRARRPAPDAFSSPSRDGVPDLSGDCARELSTSVPSRPDALPRSRLCGASTTASCVGAPGARPERASLAGERDARMCFEGAARTCWSSACSASWRSRVSSNSAASGRSAQGAGTPALVGALSAEGQKGWRCDTMREELEPLESMERV
jgi:hypothetical protein